MSFNHTATNYQPWLKLVVDEAYKWGTEGWGGHIQVRSFTCVFVSRAFPCLGGRFLTIIPPQPTKLINVNPLLTLEEATESVKNAADFVRAQNGSVVIEELPSWQAFFAKYVLTAESQPGVASTLSSRIIPAGLFTTESGKAALTSTMVQMIDQYAVNPYIQVSFSLFTRTVSCLTSQLVQVGTPFLFKGPANATSVTPAWRDGLWIVRHKSRIRCDTKLISSRWPGILLGSSTPLSPKSGRSSRSHTMSRSWCRTYHLPRERISCV
jgi:hypothetical protein